MRAVRPVRKWQKRARARLTKARRAARWSARRATSGQRPLPDFLVIGAGKSGTTSLYEYLCAHPLVCPAWTKEVNFFTFHGDRGVPWYRAHFPSRRHRSLIERRLGGPTLTGEASASYFFHPAAPERAASVVPDAKLLAIVRNPVDRAISAYHWMVRIGWEDRPIDEAFADDFRQLDAPDEPLSEHDDEHGLLRRDYLRRGHYAELLERWYRFYDPSRLLVVETAQLTRTGGEGFDRVLEFLGLPPWRPRTFVEHLAGSYPTADAALREQLARHYEPRNAALYRLLGVDWRFESTPVRSTPWSK